MIRKLKFVFVLEAFLSFFMAVIMFYALKLSNPIFILSIPFDLIGKVLRWLSLSSFAGNVTALLLYILLSFIPMLFLIVRAVRHKLNKPDILLPILSIYSFYMMYEFINPQLMPRHAFLSDASMLPMIKLSFSIVFYTLLIAYLILNMVSHLDDIPSENKLGNLCTHLSKILIILAGLYTFLVSYIISFDLFQNIGKYFSQDRGSINLYYLIVNNILVSLPIIFTILTLISGIGLLLTMVTDHLNENEFLAAKRLSTISKQTVYITVLSNIASNALQFLFSNQLNDTNYSIDISLLPLIVAFIAMILSGYFKESMELYEDNNMII